YCALNTSAAIDDLVGLEESMSTEVENSQSNGSKTAFYDHVPHWPHRGIGQGPLDTALGQHGDGADQDRQGANDKQQVQGRRREAEKRGQTVDEKSSGIHNAGVKHGGYGCGGLNRPR